MLTQGDILGLLGVYGYVTCVIVLSHLLRNRLHNARKLVHILTGGIVFFWWSFDTPWVMAGLAALPFVPILLLMTPISPIKKLRESSLGEISSGGHPYGLVLYAISWTVIAFFLFDDLFAASIAIAAMSFGDGAGELIGRRYGKREYVPSRNAGHPPGGRCDPVWHSRERQRAKCRLGRWRNTAWRPIWLPR